MDQEKKPPPSAHDLLMERFAAAPERLNGAKALEDEDARPGHWLVLLPGSSEPQLFVAGPAGIDALLEEFLNPVIDFAALRAAALRSILDAVSAARLRRVPAVAYIETEYQMLAQEADAYVAAGRPAEVSGLGFLVEAAAQSGNSLSDEADAIRAKRDAYVAVLRVTYALRKEAQEAIAATPDDVAAIEAVKENYVGQLASI